MFQRNLLPPAIGLKCTWLPRCQQKQNQTWKNRSSQSKPKKGKKGIKDKGRGRPMVAWRVGGFTLGGMEKEKKQNGLPCSLVFTTPSVPCVFAFTVTYPLPSFSSYMVLIVYSCPLCTNKFLLHST